ncbi:MAG: adenylyl-sulfate kinase [Alphaproteobacteria bacterium]|nr:adenylyl-sulfate kinase [Alphaproteobacteria bacterium]
MTEQKAGCVYWITGLPGAGKTTIAQAMHRAFLSRNVTSLVIDGDAVRQVLQRTEDHGLEARKELAQIYGRLCRLVSDQGINVICATVSMFDDVRRWNRTNIPRYVEIYLKAPIDVLAKRDKNGIYGRAKSGELENVLGINADFEEPKNPDLTITADFRQSATQIATEILEAFPPRTVPTKLESER